MWCNFFRVIFLLLFSFILLFFFFLFSQFTRVYVVNISYTYISGKVSLGISI